MKISQLGSSTKGAKSKSYKLGTKENSKERKRRIWLEKKQKRAENPLKETEQFSGWMFLPDLILEHIFKFLTYRVS